ncbi:PREDICTED: ICOS ligand [Gavialis gangeticus]|uniref:ICOS ligand n=1 Tax=Gavialis gangeticus TaxID=94835 RepID=UPI00092F404F|nr:PREDICTED: ICOS ligand [Gavialis gangeticus]
MARASSGVLLLFFYVLRTVIAVEEKEVTSIVGNTAELRCIYSKENIDLSQLRIYWQIADDLKTCSVVHALILGEDNQSDQCNNFKDRTRLLKDKLEDGDFSLLLLNITPRDEHTYRCIVQKKMDRVFKVDYDTAVVLRVAANYSQPVLHGPTENRPNIEEEITFTCKSSGGYPEPKVYWTNEDNISLPEPNMTVIQDPDGTYSVFSTLKIKSTSKMKIGCSIENRVLQQNLTTPNFEKINQDQKEINEPDSSPSKPDAKVISIVIIGTLIAALIGLTCLLWKRKSCRQALYTDVQQNEEGAQCNAPV